MSVHDQLQKLRAYFFKRWGVPIEADECKAEYTRSGATWYILGKLSDHSKVALLKKSDLLELVEHLRNNSTRSLGVAFDTSLAGCFTGIYVSFDWST